MHDIAHGSRKFPSAAKRARMKRPDAAEPPFIVLANREPYRHQCDGAGQIVVEHASAGVVNAVEPLVRAHGGVWVAHGSGTADREAARARDGVLVPPEDPRYRLRRVWLTEEEEHGYYDGFANEGLWPLCHQAHVRPVFRASDFSTYSLVNGRFAEAVCEEARGPAPIVLVQDYHFALAPLLIRGRLPESTIATFWHIPWPQWQTFELCPWRHYLLEGLLNSDIVALQTSRDRLNFIETAARVLQLEMDPAEHVVRFGRRRVHVRVYPASIDCQRPVAGEAPAIEACRANVRRALRVPDDVRLAVGVDRLDYTKGIEEKLQAVERLLEWYPELRGRVALVQVAEPSRTRLPAYCDLRQRVVQAAARINRRFGDEAYQPVVLLESHHEPRQVHELLRAADVCYVGSLHDGMNLVSKEFVHARDDEQGVLVLSQFAGAAEELTDAVIVNPYDVDDAANALASAFTMSRATQRQRMRRMRAVVDARDAHWWGEQLLADLAELRQQQGRHAIEPSSQHAGAEPLRAISIAGRPRPVLRASF